MTLGSDCLRPAERRALEAAEQGTLDLAEAARLIARLGRLRHGHAIERERDRNRDPLARKADAFDEVCEGFAAMHQMLRESEDQRLSLLTRAERAERHAANIERVRGRSVEPPEPPSVHVVAPCASRKPRNIAERVMEAERLHLRVAELQQQLRQERDGNETLRAAVRDEASRRIALEHRLWSHSDDNEAQDDLPLSSLAGEIAETLDEESITQPANPPEFYVTQHALERYRQRGHLSATEDDVLRALARGTFADVWLGRASGRDAWVIVPGGAFPVKEEVNGRRQLVATTFLSERWAGQRRSAA